MASKAKNRRPGLRTFCQMCVRGRADKTLVQAPSLQEPLAGPGLPVCPVLTDLPKDTGVPGTSLQQQPRLPGEVAFLDFSWMRFLLNRVVGLKSYIFFFSFLFLLLKHQAIQTQLRWKFFPFPNPPPPAAPLRGLQKGPERTLIKALPTFSTADTSFLLCLWPVVSLRGESVSPPFTILSTNIYWATTACQALC